MHMVVEGKGAMPFGAIPPLPLAARVNAVLACAPAHRRIYAAEGLLLFVSRHIFVLELCFRCTQHSSPKLKRTRPLCARIYPSITKSSIA